MTKGIKPPELIALHRLPADVILEHIVDVVDMETSGVKKQLIAEYLSEVSKIEVKPYSIARALRPFSESDPRPHCIVAGEIALAKFNAAVTFKERHDATHRKPGRPSSTVQSPGSAQPLAPSSSPAAKKGFMSANDRAAAIASSEIPDDQLPITPEAALEAARAAYAVNPAGLGQYLSPRQFRLGQKDRRVKLAMGAFGKLREEHLAAGEAG